MFQPNSWHSLPFSSQDQPGLPVMTGSAPSPGSVCPSVSPMGSYVCLCPFLGLSPSLWTSVCLSLALSTILGLFFHRHQSLSELSSHPLSVLALCASLNLSPGSPSPTL